MLFIFELLSFSSLRGGKDPQHSFAEAEAEAGRFEVSRPGRAGGTVSWKEVSGACGPRAVCEHPYPIRDLASFQFFRDTKRQAYIVSQVLSFFFFYFKKTVILLVYIYFY